VLEIGFGPGIAIRELARRAADGRVCGIDHSEVMLRQASRRNADAIRRGAVDLRLGSVDALPDFDAPFDKIMAVNALLFWREPDARLRALSRLLRPGRPDRRGPPAARPGRKRSGRRGQGPGDGGHACPSRILGRAGPDHATETRGRVRARPQRSERVKAPTATTRAPAARAPSAKRSTPRSPASTGA
jgi:SAM-dependent methyltransferase